MAAFGFTIGPVSAQVSLVAMAVSGLLLLAFAQATRRAQRRLKTAAVVRRRSVVVLNGVAFLAMLLLLIPLGVERPATQRVSLATEGAPAPRTGVATYRLDTMNADQAAPIPAIRNAGELALLHPALQTLEVSGHGLEASQWAALPGTWDVAWDAPPLTGPVDLRWPSMIAYGDALSLTGVLRNDDEGLAQLRLLDPAGVEVDAVTLANDDPFSLRAVPRAPGPMVYRLQLVLDGRVVQDEPVAVHVRESPPMRLLVLQSAPSFETRQLANWAADRGGELLVKTRISRDRELLQRVNLPADTPGLLTGERLAETDLAVIDGRRWAGLDGTARAQLLQAARNGLGILLFADQALAAWLEDPAQAALLGLRLVSDATGKAQALPAGRAAPSSPLPVAPWRLALRGAQSLTRDDQGEPLEAWTRHGQGRLAVSRLRERHRWATSGQASTFARYWSRILRTLGRARSHPRWLVPERLPRLRVGRRAQFCAHGDPGQSLRLRFAPLDRMADEDGGPDALRMVAHQSGSPLLCGYGWPAAGGWYALHLVDERDAVVDAMMLRVTDVDEWRADTFDRRQRATAERAAVDGGPAPARVAQPFPTTWACLVLLLSLALLWAERRLFELDEAGSG